jgi:cytochrome oxidase Cu insertion factor (SCO1/SenC/PrrC family)
MRRNRDHRHRMGDIDMHTTRSKLPAPLAVLAALGVVVLGLLLTACGGDKKNSSSSANAVDQTAQTRFKHGDPAPDFTLSTSDGGTVALASYKDRQPVLLFFHMAVG